jgi:transketolase
MSTYNLIRALDEIDAAGVNVKLVAVPSPQLFALQPEAYRETVLSAGDRMNSTYVTNRSRRVMRDWVFNPLADRYALSSDRDDRWRPGGSVDELCTNAGIDPAGIAAGVIRFANDYELRMKELKEMLAEAQG